MTPVGSSGDVHPFVGIGRELRRRGHEVFIFATGNFRDTIEREGLVLVETASALDYERLASDPELWYPLRGLRVVLRATLEGVPRTYELLSQHHVPGRTVVVGHTLGFAARVFEEVHRVPAATLQLAPSVFRSDYAQPAPMTGVDASRWPRWVKRGLWWLVDRFLIDPYAVPLLNEWRATFGLAPVSRIFAGWVNSPQCVVGLFPPWFAPPQPDWPRALRLTGFPLFDEAGQHPLDEALEAFLDEGQAPLVFTPGSANKYAHDFFEAAVDAALRMKRRALLLTPHRQQVPARLPPSVRHIPYAPFSQLLPRCAALVHHGGIGTSGQGLAAGVPQLVMPMGFDQPDNATRLHRIGVGTWLLPQRFTGARLAGALDGLLHDARVSTACRHWAEAIRVSRPIEETCDVLEGRIARIAPS